MGNCYNPFQEFKGFDVLPIDLCPALESVYQCDCLQVSVEEKTRKAAARTLRGFFQNRLWWIDAIFCVGSTTIGINDVHPTRFAQSQ